MSRRTHDLALLWRLFAFGWHHRGFLALMLAATAAMGAAQGYQVLALNEMIALMRNADAGDGAAIDGMTRLSWRLLILVVPVTAAAYGAWISGQVLANRCMRDLRDRFLSHLIRLELAYHAGLARGDLITRMTADIAWCQGLFQNLFGKIIQRPVATLGIIGGLFVVDWRFASVIFLALVPLAAVLQRLLRRTRRRSRTAREKLSENIIALEQITAGIRVIKAMGSAEAECRRYAAANHNLFTANIRVAHARAQTEAITNGAIYLIMATALALGAVAFRHHMISMQDLITFFGGLALVTTHLRGGTRTWGEIQESLPAAERVFEVLDRPSAVVDKPDAIDCPPPAREIRLERVGFSYGSDGAVLRGVDLVVPVGSTVALVGESGAGKSTILDLIPRFRDVVDGRITIDGVDVRDLRHDSLMRHVAIVQQDSFLFNDTVYDNIRYGRPDATREQIETAARRAHIHDTILGLEGGLGYQTMVGDRGERLSGGQRQRVAIARALLRDAPLLLLDEPTSALDADSEHHVKAALSELMRGRTSVVVAHRLSTIQHADIIYVLSRQSGTVIEHGTHQELVAQGGEYARLVEMQKL